MMVVLTTQVYTFVKNTLNFVHFKWVPFIICKLYHNKVDFFLKYVYKKKSRAIYTKLLPIVIAG